MSSSSSASGVLVLELKGKLEPSQADFDQAAAYARDLRCYHRECWDRWCCRCWCPRARRAIAAGRTVFTSPAPMRWILVEKLAAPHRLRRSDRRGSSTSRVPPPSDAGRGGTRAVSSPELGPFPVPGPRPILPWSHIAAIVHHAASDEDPAAHPVTGVPGAGKTLVGLRTVHARYLDDLAVPRSTEPYGAGGVSDRQRAAGARYCNTNSAEPAAKARSLCAA